MAMERRNMLLEIGTEELPTTYIQPALDQLRTWGERWALASSITVWGTPRRLVLFIKDLPHLRSLISQNFLEFASSLGYANRWIEKFVNEGI